MRGRPYHSVRHLSWIKSVHHKRLRSERSLAETRQAEGSKCRPSSCAAVTTCRVQDYHQRWMLAMDIRSPSTTNSTHGNVVLGHVDRGSGRQDHNGGLDRLERRFPELVLERKNHLTPEMLVHGADLVDLMYQMGQACRIPVQTCGSDDLRKK